jgi:hypothetical protein
MCTHRFQFFPIVWVVENTPYVHICESLVHIVIIIHHEVNGGMHTSLPLFKYAEKLKKNISSKSCLMNSEELLTAQQTSANRGGGREWNLWGKRLPNKFSVEKIVWMTVSAIAGCLK